MPLLPRRFERLKSVLNHRMADLTVLLEHVEKPHNLSAILRSCDAVGALEAHAVSFDGRPRTFNSTAQGSQKWVPLHDHPDTETAIRCLKEKGFRLYGTHLGVNARDYRECDFTGPTAFVLGAEKWGLTDQARDLMDEALFIPMRGMVQSLNVSVATATHCLRRCANASGRPSSEPGRGLKPELYQKLLFEWSYPEVANWCREQEKAYPALSEEGELMEELPRTVSCAADPTKTLSPRTLGHNQQRIVSNGQQTAAPVRGHYHCGNEWGEEMLQSDDLSHAVEAAHAIFPSSCRISIREVKALKSLEVQRCRRGTPGN